MTLKLDTLRTVAKTDLVRFIKSATCEDVYVSVSSVNDHMYVKVSKAAILRELTYEDNTCERFDVDFNEHNGELYIG